MAVVDHQVSAGSDQSRRFKNRLIPAWAIDFKASRAVDENLQRRDIRGWEAGVGGRWITKDDVGASGFRQSESENLNGWVLQILDHMSSPHPTVAGGFGEVDPLQGKATSKDP